MTLQRIDKDFIHRTGVHCESTVTSSLLFNYGIEASEPLVFGMGSGIFFGYFSYIKSIRDAADCFPYHAREDPEEHNGTARRQY